MILFQPDNHSSDSVGLAPADSKLLGMVNIAMENFGITQYEEPLVIGSVNINSLNFKVGSYYLKLVENSSGEKAYLQSFPALALKLNSLQIPSPSFIPNLDGSYLTSVSFDEKVYIALLQNFVGNTFFSGSLAELEQMVQLMKKLGPPNCEELRKQVNGARSIVTDSREYQRKIQKLGKRIDEKKEQDDFDKMVLENFRNLESSSRNQVCSATTSLFHCDLHPHNILSTNEMIQGIVDLESFVLMNEDVFKGFSFFKLARKCIQKDSTKLIGIKKLIPSLGDKDVLLKATQSELLRRAFLILDLHYEKAVTTWDFDLQKQIQGFQEAKIIYE